MLKVKISTLILTMILLSGKIANAEFKKGEKLDGYNAFYWENIDHPVDKYFRSFIRKWNIVGLSVAIVKDDKLIYTKGFGYANKELNEKMAPTNILRIASVSKLVTAAAIMKLQEKNYLTLEDKVFGKDGILNDPSFLSYKDKRFEEITIRHLLSHSAGWLMRYGDHMFMNRTIARKMKAKLPLDLNTIIKFAMTKRLHFQPGTYSSYSNLGYAILSRIIEKITNRSYENFVRTEILEPIDIYDMSLAFNFEEERKINEVKYYEQKNARLVKSFNGSNKLVKKSYGGNDVRLLGGAGAWLASSISLARFVCAIDGKDGDIEDILSEESIEEMLDSGRLDPLGWRSVRNDVYCRTGSFSGTSALVKKLPNGYTYVVLCNSSSWKASKFPPYISGMMNKVIKKIEQTDNYDLFDKYFPIRFSPVPLVNPMFTLYFQESPKKIKY